MSSRVTLHFLATSRADSILWLLEELEIPYDIKCYARLETGKAPPELKAIHPLGKSPVIEYNGSIVAETGAIIAFLLTTSRFPSASRFQVASSATEEEKLRDSHFSYYAEGSLMGSLVNKRVLGGLPQALPWIQGEIKNHLDFLEKELAKSPTLFIAGGDYPTAGDFAIYFPLFVLAQKGRADPLPVPDIISKWVEKMQAREGFVKARKRLEEAEAQQV